MYLRYEQYTLAQGLQKIKTRTAALLAAAALVFAGGLGLALTSLNPASAAVTVAGCEFDDLTVAGVWSLTGNCTTSGPLNVTANTVVEGNGYTISADYDFGSNGDGTNTVVGIVNANNVTLNNVIIDGTAGLNLHGVNVYVSQNVILNDVTILNNDKSGLVVNGSNVTANNITTSGNVWNGVNVAQGSGVNTASVLTVLGTSSHSELANIYLDNVVAQDVTVNDVENQYIMFEPTIPAGRPFDVVYNLANKELCKANGWKNILTSSGAAFKNQGLCIASVQSNVKSKHNQ